MCAPQPSHLASVCCPFSFKTYSVPVLPQAGQVRVGSVEYSNYWHKKSVQIGCGSVVKPNTGRLRNPCMPAPNRDAPLKLQLFIIQVDSLNTAFGRAKIRVIRKPKAFHPIFLQSYWTFGNS